MENGFSLTMPVKKKGVTKAPGQAKAAVGSSQSFEKAGPSNVAFGLQMLAASVPEGGI